jgi:hypothetical protein
MIMEYRCGHGLLTRLDCVAHGDPFATVSGGESPPAPAIGKPPPMGRASRPRVEQVN